MTNDDTYATLGLARFLRWGGGLGSPPEKFLFFSAYRLIMLYEEFHLNIFTKKHI